MTYYKSASLKRMNSIKLDNKPKKNYNKKVKYRAMKFDGDDKYSWAVFYGKDVKGFRSPIFGSMGIKPIIAGCSQSEARYYIKKLEIKDAENVVSTGETVS